jgi:hypothetical protein
MCKYHKTKYLANMCLHIVVFNESRLKKNELKKEVGNNEEYRNRKRDT